MAYLREKLRHDEQAVGPRRKSIGLGGFACRVAASGVGVAVAAWAMASVAGVYSAASLSSTGSFLPQTRPLLAKAAPVDPRTFAFRLAKIAPQTVQQGKSARLTVAAAPLKGTLAASAPQDPFGRAVSQAALSPDRLRAAFRHAGMAVAEHAPAKETLVAALPEDRFGKPEDRFGKVVSQASLSPDKVRAALEHARIALDERAAQPVRQAAAPVQLAYADPQATALDALAALAIPDSVPLPPSRPRKAAADPAAPAAPPPQRAAKPAPQPAAEALAYAQPDKPKTGGIAGAFRGLFDTPRKPEAGVAVYDISAGLVYMPDGQKLEAHSGIGRMADNPRYVNVKNTGPTPPDTYRLSMRESRFYGVEAIRLTPVDGRTKLNRTGLLAHSYLLRGGRAESHGCVAFKNYPLFLKAFKQGKIRQLVVVPSISDTRYASLGAGA